MKVWRCALVVCLWMSWAHGQDSDVAPSEDQTVIVARVDGVPLTLSSLKVFALRIGVPQHVVAETLPEDIYKQLLSRLIDHQAVVGLARDSGLAEDPEYRSRLQQLSDGLLHDLYVSRAIDTRITEDMLQEAYDEFAQGYEGKEEARAQHILVKEEARARELIAQLDEGADFTELAKEHSQGPSGPNGGDLGWFTAERMVAPFSVAVFKLEPGSYASTPVQTDFGWHVIKLNEKRKAVPPPLEAVAQQLGEQLSKKVALDIFAEARRGATIEVFAQDGSAP